MRKPTDKEFAEAREEYATVAAQADRAIYDALERLAVAFRAAPEALLAGAIAAMVRFTFNYCWAPSRVRTERALVEVIGPIVRFSAKREGAV